MRYFLLVLMLFCRTGPVLAKETCIYCKGDTQLQVLQFADGPKSVCALCLKKYPACSICGNPTNLPQHRDQRFFCPSCKKTGIFSDTQAIGLQKEVVNFLQSQLGPTALNPCPPIRMCDKDELQTKFIEHGRAMNVGGFYSPYNPEMVYLLTGESAIELQSTMAHEYTHAWQSRNCGQQDRAVTEGFATYIQYKFLVSKGKMHMAERLTRHQDPDYGASLNKLLEREKSMGGVKNVVEWAKKARSLNDK